MDDVTRVSWIGLGVGGLSITFAGVLVLMRRTRGLPAGRRVIVMARLAAEAVWHALPPAWMIVGATAGLLAFSGTLAVGLAVTILVVRAIPPEVPHPTEAYEGFGDAMMAMFRLMIGAGLSFTAASVAGAAAAISSAAQWVRDRSPSTPRQARKDAHQGGQSG